MPTVDVGHVYVTEAKDVATVTVDGARCPSEYVPIAVQSAEAGCSSENMLIADQLVEAEHVNETVDQYDEAENVNETVILTDGSRRGKIPAFSPNEWDEEIIGVGQQFQSGEAFRAALFKYAFAKRFNYKFIKNHNTQMSVVCAVKGCCWKLTAHSWKGSGPLRVKQFVDSHRHSKQDDIDWKPALNAKMILELVGKKIASSPNYSAKEIRKDIESKYNLNLPYHMVPVLEFMKAHQEMVAELLVSRKRDVASWKGPVGDKIELKIKENLCKSQYVVTRRLSESMYEFRLESSVGVVDLSSRTCTCLEWQMIGIPCEHACGVMQEANLDVNSCVETWYRKETQEAIYAEVMNALPPEDTASLDEVSDSRCCAPLDVSPACNTTNRKRIRRQPEPESMKRAFTCSDCNKKGHNRRSCEKRMKSWMLL
ncbi:Zinc finger, SWIM-type [Dillenia turbinata]|uniref:Zinc finger, SWIM-type n=1 Tax=Dillenia turbinata TaxID=194707 RepID=A0AAN8W787_9MAGN